MSTLQRGQAGSLVVIRVEIFNGADPPILYAPSTSIQVTITDPTGVAVVTLGAMTSEGTGIYRYNWQSSPSAELGDYLVAFKTVDATWGTHYEPAVVGFVLVDEEGVATTPGELVGINADFLLGKTWAAPGAIGSTTPSSGAFTTLSGAITDKGGQWYNVQANYGGAATGVLPANSGPANSVAFAALVALTQLNSPPGGTLFFPPGAYLGHFNTQDTRGIHMIGASIAASKLSTYDSDPVVNIFSNIGSGSVSDFGIRNLYLSGTVRIWNALFGDLSNLRIDGLLSVQGSGIMNCDNCQVYGSLNAGNGSGALTGFGPLTFHGGLIGGGSTVTAIDVNGGGSLTMISTLLVNQAGGAGAPTVLIDGDVWCAFYNCDSESTFNSASDGATFLVGSRGGTRPRSLTINGGHYYGHGNGTLTQRDWLRLAAGGGVQTLVVHGVVAEGAFGVGYGRSMVRAEAGSILAGDAISLAANTYVNFAAGGVQYSDATGRIATSAGGDFHQGNQILTAPDNTHFNFGTGAPIRSFLANNGVGLVYIDINRRSIDGVFGDAAATHSRIGMQSSNGLGKIDFSTTNTNGIQAPLVASILPGGLDLAAGSYLSGTEQTAPAAPAANGYRLFARDSGAGKTQLCVIFATGAVQVLATEP